MSYSRKKQPKLCDEKPGIWTRAIIPKSKWEEKVLNFYYIFVNY